MRLKAAFVAAVVGGAVAAAAVARAELRGDTRRVVPLGRIGLDINGWWRLSAEGPLADSARMGVVVDVAPGRLLRWRGADSACKLLAGDAGLASVAAVVGPARNTTTAVVSHRERGCYHAFFVNCDAAPATGTLVFAAGNHQRATPSFLDYNGHRAIIATAVVALASAALLFLWLFAASLPRPVLSRPQRAFTAALAVQTAAFCAAAAVLAHQLVVGTADAAYPLTLRALRFLADHAYVLALAAPLLSAAVHSRALSIALCAQGVLVAVLVCTPPEYAGAWWALLLCAAAALCVIAVAVCAYCLRSAAPRAVSAFAGAYAFAVAAFACRYALNAFLFAALSYEYFWAETAARALIDLAIFAYVACELRPSTPKLRAHHSTDGKQLLYL